MSFVCLFVRLVGLFVCFFVCFVVCLVGWLVGWLFSSSFHQMLIFRWKHCISVSLDAVGKIAAHADHDRLLVSAVALVSLALLV